MVIDIIDILISYKVARKISFVVCGPQFEKNKSRNVRSYIYIKKIRSIATCFLQILHSKIHAAIPRQYYSGLTFTIAPKIIISSKIAFRFFK